MKNKLIKPIKIILIIIVTIFAFILLDSLQALIFNNKPIIGIETKCCKKEGILVDTYYCSHDDKQTVIKGFSYSCSYDDNYNIIDTSKDIENFTCDTALEKFYEDDKYYYSFNCIKSSYVVVIYSDGKKENIQDALKLGHVNIGDLDKFDISYIKEEK